MILVPFGRFRQRIDAIEKMLAAVGDAETRDTRTQGSERSVSFSVTAPGYGSPTEAVFEYRERYRRTREGWLRDRYFYEYRPQPPPSRRAHHDHEPYGIHQHCREPRRPEAHRHCADVPRLLEHTHEEFAHLYLRESEIRCAGLRPLLASVR